jgi:hypothetical protein
MPERIRIYRRWQSVILEELNIDVGPISNWVNLIIAFIFLLIFYAWDSN